MICPRDANDLHTESEHGITVDRCPACHGAWYDYDEPAELESTVAGEDQRIGTIEFAKHQSVLVCPVCGDPMHAFNYRAYNLELDACSEGHGFWLDAGESDRVREIMHERVRGLRRAGSAQQSWARAKGRNGGGGVIEQIKGLFTGRRWVSSSAHCNCRLGAGASVALTTARTIRIPRALRALRGS